MIYKTFVSMNIAIIGESDYAKKIAIKYAQAGHEVLVAWKSNVKVFVTPAMEQYDNLSVCTIEEAAHLADVIIIIAHPRDVREIAYWLGDVRATIIIDATSNIQIGSDEAINTTGAIKAITGSPYIVKVFSTNGYQQMLKPLLKKDDIQWILAGDSIKAKEATKILAKDVGIDNFIDLGDSESFPLFDAMAKCFRELAAKQPGVVIKAPK
jgi:predicted dinucleotide-binding enzyme